MLFRSRLEHARGSIPVDNGYVHASWRRQGGSVELECTVPPGTTATVRLPAGTYGVKGPTADDAVVLSAPVGADDGATRDFRVHTGTWTFTPRWSASGAGYAARAARAGGR